MADQLGKSVGDMYAGAFVPALVLSGLYVAYIVLVTIIKPEWAPALPPEARTLRGARLWLRVVTTLLPPLLLFFWFSARSSSASRRRRGRRDGRSGAVLLAVVRRRSLKLMKQAMERTAKLTAFVVFILIGARVFSLTFYGVNGHLG